MSRINTSVLWDYFKKINGTKKALCTFCGEEYSFVTTTGNLKAHLRKKHTAAYKAVDDAQKAARLNDNNRNDSVIYEYVVVPSPTSSANESTTAECLTNATLQSRESGQSPLAKRLKLPQAAKGSSKASRLIEELTKEKIHIANLQKELIEKEMEEKNLKILLLQEEMQHKKLLYELETQEIEHRKQEMEHKEEINDLAKQEMLLKIEVLNYTLNNCR